MMHKKGIMVVGHGSKSKDAVDEFNLVVEMMRPRLPEAKLIGAHMEINDPDIPSAIDQFIAEDIFHITIVPYFLFMGKHIQNDIPEILRRKKLIHPELILNYSHPVGADPLIAEILLQRSNGSILKQI